MIFATLGQPGILLTWKAEAAAPRLSFQASHAVSHGHGGGIGASHKSRWNLNTCSAVDVGSNNRSHQ
jgi:hypothetical protein